MVGRTGRPLGQSARVLLDPLLALLRKRHDFKETANEVPLMVYSARTVLAVSLVGPGALPAGLAAPPALPPGLDCRVRRPRAGLGDHHPARPPAPRALAPTPKQGDQFDNKDNHHHYLQYESAALVKL